MAFTRSGVRSSLAPPILLVSFAGVKSEGAWLAETPQGLDRTFEFGDFSEAFGLFQGWL